MHQRAALYAEEDRLVDRLGKFLAAEDHAASGTAQGLVGGGGDELAVGHGVGMNARGDQARDVRHVDHQIRADLVRDRSEAREVDDAGIGGRARDDQLGLAFLGDLEHLVVIDAVGDAVHAVGYEVEVFAGHVDGRAVGQVSALVEVHAHDGVAGVEHGKIDRHVRLSARMGLHIGMLCAEQLAGALTGDLLDDVDAFAAAVVALAGIALGVFVGEVAAHRRHHGGSDNVFAGDQLEVSALSFQFLVWLICSLCYFPFELNFDYSLLISSIIYVNRAERGILT